MKAGIGSRLGILLGALFLCLFPSSAQAAVAEENLFSHVEEAQIRPIKDGSEKYLLKSDSFYCLKEDGTKHAEAGVHYFDHMEIDGTVFNGFYYHDETGHFMAGTPHIVSIKGLSCETEDSEKVFDGLYMANNLEKLSAAPQIRYISGLMIDKTSYEGYYYFNEDGRMVTEPGLHTLEMASNGQMFSGTYYFGGNNGVLVQEAGVTPEGFPVDETGKVSDMENLGMETLEPQLKSMIAGYEGTWSIYVKNLNTEEEIILNDQKIYPASLIKAFVMAASYENMDQILEHEAALMKKEPDDAEVQTKVNDLLWNMITVSDNESCNELGRLQSEKHDFLDGAEKVNEFIQKEGYSDTVYQSTLHPSASPKVSMGEHNTSTVSDCGALLESIFRGDCVSKEASEKMLELLMNQRNTTKIPAGISADIPIANKTGETDQDQHDMAIVYGPKTTYILCVMSEDFKSAETAIENIRTISGAVYNYLNF